MNALLFILFGLLGSWWVFVILRARPKIRRATSEFDKNAERIDRNFQLIYGNLILLAVLLVLRCLLWAKIVHL